MKNLWVIPTDKPSNLCINGKNQQNIYITNSEDIKEGDIVKIPCGVGKVKELHWKYGNNNPSYIVEDVFTYKLRYGQKEGELQTNSFRYEDVKKIILTTDADLIKDGVQTIEDEFIQWFVKNSSCERVKVLRCPIEGSYTVILKEEVLIQSSIDGEVIWSTAKETLEEITEQIQNECHSFIESVPNVNYQDATNTFLFMKLAELTLKLKKYETKNT
jgi:hypothetical protein